MQLARKENTQVSEKIDEMKAILSKTNSNERSLERILELLEEIEAEQEELLESAEALLQDLNLALDQLEQIQLDD